MSPLMPLLSACVLSQAQPSPQSAPLPPAAAVVASQPSQPAPPPATATPLTLQVSVPAVYLVPAAPAPAAVQPVSYTVAAAPTAFVAAPMGVPAQITTLRQPGPVRRGLATLGDHLVRLREPRLRTRSALVVGVTPVVAPAPAPAPAPVTNGAGLVEPAAILPSKQTPTPR